MCVHCGHGDLNRNLIEPPYHTIKFIISVKAKPGSAWAHIGGQQEQQQEKEAAEQAAAPVAEAAAALERVTIEEAPPAQPAAEAPAPVAAPAPAPAAPEAGDEPVVAGAWGFVFLFLCGMLGRDLLCVSGAHGGLCGTRGPYDH